MDALWNVWEDTNGRVVVEVAQQGDLFIRLRLTHGDAKMLAGALTEYVERAERGEAITREAVPYDPHTRHLYAKREFGFDGVPLGRDAEAIERERETEMELAQIRHDKWADETYG